MMNNESISYGCVRGDCINGVGVYVDTNGDEYEGSFKEGKPHGEGKMTLPDGTIYEGKWK